MIQRAYFASVQVSAALHNYRLAVPFMLVLILTLVIGGVVQAGPTVGGSTCGQGC